MSCPLIVVTWPWMPQALSELRSELRSKVTSEKSVENSISNMSSPGSGGREPVLSGSLMHRVRQDGSTLLRCWFVLDDDFDLSFCH